MILNEAGHATFVCNSIDELGREIVSGAGFAIVALEAFAVPDLAPIADAIDAGAVVGLPVPDTRQRTVKASNASSFPNT